MKVEVNLNPLASKLRDYGATGSLRNVNVRIAQRYTSPTYAPKAWDNGETMIDDLALPDKMFRRTTREIDYQIEIVIGVLRAMMKLKNKFYQKSEFLDVLERLGIEVVKIGRTFEYHGELPQDVQDVIPSRDWYWAIQPKTKNKSLVKYMCRICGKTTAYAKSGTMIACETCSREENALVALTPQDGSVETTRTEINTYANA